MENILHPGIYLGEEIKKRGWTQKHFSQLVNKPNSEINELIKGKRNITVQWDIILSTHLGTTPKKWLQMQIDYDYNQYKGQEKKEIKKSEPLPEVKKAPKEIVKEEVKPAYKHDKEKEKIFRNF